MNTLSALPLWIAALLAGMVLGGLLVWARTSPRKRLLPLPTEWQLVARRVLNAEERRVYNQLRLTFPQYIVLPKLPLVRLCQPDTPDQVQYWYELIGAAHVTFAVCSPQGRVLLAIDLDHTRSHSRRSTKIKESVLAACGIPRLHCAADALPAADELRLLVQPPASANVAAQPASAHVPPPRIDSLPAPLTLIEPTRVFDAPASALPAAQASAQSGDEPVSASPTDWQDSSVFLDPFFANDDRLDPSPDRESPRDLSDWPPLAEAHDPNDEAAHSTAMAAPATASRWSRTPVRLAGGL